MISVGTALSAISQFIGERFPVDKLNFHSMVEKKEVPIHRMSWGYYTGGLTMFFFMIQVITGLFLLFYYQPTVSDANVSVEYINKYVAGGALIRNMHAWSSSFMILFAMVHLLTAFAMKSFFLLEAIGVVLRVSLETTAPVCFAKSAVAFSSPTTYVL